MSLATRQRVGIDLGTTNCCCYYEQGDTVVCLNYDNGENTLPSYVGYKKDGTTIVGKRAKNKTSSDDCVIVHNTKRMIGRMTKSKEVQEDINDFGVPVEDRNGFPVLRIRDDLQVTPGNVATVLLKFMLDRVRTVTGTNPTDVCVTIPAHFDNNQRTATLQAIIDAGVPSDHITILNEPTAAALCYGVENNADNTRILVYDLGGGTFDVSIMSIRNGEFTVDRYEGDPHLGGGNFDSALLNYLEEGYRDYMKTGFIPDECPPKIRSRHRHKLLNLVEQCKKQLAFSDDAWFTMKPITGMKMDQGYIDELYEVTVTYDTLDKVIKNDIQRTRETVEMALRKENLTVRDIDRVVLVGGSSRLRLVRSLLKEMFGEEKLRESVNPDECVAKGACLYLKSNRRPKERIAYSLSKSIINDRLLCVIPRMSLLPASYSVTTCTASDNQESVSSSVYQAQQENNDDTMSIDDSVHALAPYSFTGFKIAAAGEVSFLTTFDIEECGIVYITVVEKDTGKVLLDKHMIQYESSFPVCWIVTDFPRFM